MKKHITVQAVVVPGFNKVIFKVNAQTHTGNSFGNACGADPRKFTATNGITLGSNSHPARDTDDKNTIWLRGSKIKSNNGAIECTDKEWLKIAEAIRQYNAFNFVVPAPKAPAAPRYAAANPCAVIVG